MSSNAALDSTQSSSDSPQWSIKICDSIVAVTVKELAMEDSLTVCICQVPESLSCSKKEAFVPQFVGLGPYHHSRKGLMKDGHKLAAAKRVLKDLLSNMELFQQRISKFDSHIQSFYHPDVKSTYDNDTNTLFYVLTVDALFLLAFITLLSSDNSDGGLGFSFFLNGKLAMPFFNTAGIELTRNVLIREVFKLENQIPFHVLQQITGANEIQSDDEALSSNVHNFCKQQCPLVKFEELPSKLALEGRHHLLDLMYHLIVPKPQPETQADAPALVQVSAGTGAQDEGEAGNGARTGTVAQDDGEAGNGTRTVTVAQDEGEAGNGTRTVTVAQDEGEAGNGTGTVTVAQDEGETGNRTRTVTVAQDEGETGNGTRTVTVAQDEGEAGNGTGNGTGAKVVVPQVQAQSSGNGMIRRCCSGCFNILFILAFVCIILGYMFLLIFRLVMKVLGFFWACLIPVLGCVHSILCGLDEKFDKPYLKTLKDLVGNLLRISEAQQSTDSGVGPVVLIPSVEKLHQAGIFFKPAQSGILSIDFNDEECIFYLPIIRLDVNSDVIIRNLVAYETLIKSNTPLVFTRYVELMRAIIDYPADVKILADSQIIVSELTDQAIADLFNGMSKSIRPTKTPKLDEVIHKVNAKFESKQKQKRVVKKYTSSSFLTGVGGLIFLLFTALQTYCTVYNCSGSSRLGKLPDEDGEYYGRNNYFISSM